MYRIYFPLRLPSRLSKPPGDGGEVQERHQFGLGKRGILC
jgi:hypothetical protein